MKKSVIIAIVCLLTISISGKAQENLSFLKGEKKINLEYNYDNVTVGKKSEATYCSEKVADYNKKNQGKGDNWLKQWKSNRETAYQPKFEELLNKFLIEKGISAYPKNNDAKYTMTVNTIIIEPGYNIGISRKSAYITIEVVFVETANKDKVLAKKTFKNMPGATAFGEDYDVGTRVKEGYAKAGKEVAKWILKAIK